MLHNKYFEILNNFLGDYRREIYGRELVGKVNLSQKSIALALEELEKQGILKSRKSGNMKYFKLNISNPEIKDVLISTEITKKTIFFKKYKKIANLFKKDYRIVGIFGSYAKGVQNNSSDVDLFIINGDSREDYSAKGKTYDINISIKHFKEEEFKKLKENNLFKEIIKDHIIIFGVEKFINLSWGDYYGFN